MICLQLPELGFCWTYCYSASPQPLQQGYMVEIIIVSNIQVWKPKAYKIN